MTKLKKNQTVIKRRRKKIKPKLWQNSRTQTVTKLKKKQIVTKLERSNCNQTQKLKLCKTKKLNCSHSKTQIVMAIKITVVTEVVIMTSFSKNTLTP